MSCTRKLARGGKKNYAFFITFKVLENTPPSPAAINIPGTRLLIFAKFSNPLLFHPTPSPPRRLLAT